MGAWRGAAGLLVLVLACSRAQPPATPAPRAAAPAAAAPAGALPPSPGDSSASGAVRQNLPPAATSPAPDVRLPLPQAFRDAVLNGTRTAEGRPGPKYWQQRVNYRVQAELDPRTDRLSGSEQVRYVNASPDTLTSLVLHLYQNLFRPGAPRTEPTPTTEGMVLEHVLVNGHWARELRGTPSARPFYQVDHTIMGVALDHALMPGDTARLEIAWHFTVPPAGAPRMGHEGRELFQVAQWYPQVAVYDDVGGWDTHPYLGTGEFYLEYGDFDVSLTLPEGYLVGATGVLVNPEEVLTPAERERLELAQRVDTVVHVLRADEQHPGEITPQVPGGQLTWRFRARRVRDFAFSASNRYVWDATHADVGDNDRDGRPERVPINAFYRPEARTWRQAAAYTRHALAYHSASWHPYIYPQMTAAEGPEQGMEYPMLVFVSAYPSASELLSVLTHETGHEWFPMLVGSNEHDYAWQDEGLNSYIEALATLDYSKDVDVWADDMMAYMGIAGGDAEVPMMRPADLYGDERAYEVASYMKPALVLRALETVIGADRVRQGIRLYAAGWLLRHPQPYDFFNAMNGAAGQDLSWFWYPWFYTTGVLDQAVTAVQESGGRVSITIESRGEIPMPVLLRLVLGDGRTQAVTLPAGIWAGGVRSYTTTVPVPTRVDRVLLDPDGLLPDVNRGNNDWKRP